MGEGIQARVLIGNYSLMKFLKDLIQSHTSKTKNLFFFLSKMALGSIRFSVIELTQNQRDQKCLSIFDKIVIKRTEKSNGTKKHNFAT